MVLKRIISTLALGAPVEVGLTDKSKLRGRLGQVSDSGFESQIVKRGKIDTGKTALDQVKSRIPVVLTLTAEGRSDTLIALTPEDNAVALLVRKSTLILFGLIAVAAIALSLLPTMAGKVGYKSIGFPFRFFEATSAPPPAFGSSFSWEWLALDVLLYYVVALCVSFVRSLLRSLSRT